MERGDGSAGKLVFDGFLKQLGLPKSIKIFPISVSAAKHTKGHNRTDADTYWGHF